MMSHKDDIPRSVFVENAVDLELLFLLRLVFISRRRIHKWEIEIFAQKEGSGWRLTLGEIGRIPLFEKFLVLLLFKC